MYRRLHIFTFITISLLLSNCVKNANPKEAFNIATPESLYGQLFYDVQSRTNLFSDSKTFVDCIPKRDVSSIVNDYLALKDKSDSSLMLFLKNNFLMPVNESDYVTDSASINEHIAKLWTVLKRPADKPASGTLIPLPYPYVVPGGRFREIYYWDSYFTMLGLKTDNQLETIEHMVENFNHLITQYGFIPNGNRTYYLTRSQPPFFAMMVDLLASSEGNSVYPKYLPAIEKEYKFWMDGADQLNENKNVFRRVIKLSDGYVLNRYFDDSATPRAESYLEDLKTAKEATGTNKEDVYRHIRAAAESGWDFSSRWLSPDSVNQYHLSTIHTTDIIPVDLNCLLYHLETTLAKCYIQTNNQNLARQYENQASLRKQAILKYCWNASKGFFMDYDFVKNQQTEVYSLAGVFPLFIGIANQEQAKSVAVKLKQSFLKTGGLVCTVNKTNQQWDSPNGWAPLHWICIEALRKYEHRQLANDIKERWLNLNKQAYDNSYIMSEKYNVENPGKEGGGGEYPNQDGFGWTNGVYQKLSSEASQ